MPNVEQLRREIEELAEQQRAMEERSPAARAQGAQQVKEAVRETTATLEQTPGRFGVVDPMTRARTRTDVMEMGPLSQFGIEAAPGTLGAMLGGGVGSMLGPVGTVAGASLGGLAGEAIGQEFGVTPESDVGLGLAGGAPLAGPLVGGAVKMGRRGVGAGIQALPFARQAAGEIAAREAAEVIGENGVNLFARAGVAKASADDLFQTLRQSDPTSRWNVVPSEMFANSRDAALKLPREYDFVKALFSSREIPNIEFRTIANVRSKLLDVVREGSKSEKKAARGLIDALEKDMDKIAQTTSPRSGMAVRARAALRRQKLEFAVQDVDQMAIRFSKPVHGSEDAVELNVTGLRKALFDKTNPRSEAYDPKLAEALGPVTKELNKSLARLEESIFRGSPGGPGSLVIQGRMAAIGGAAGGLLAGAPGVAGGAIAATAVPRVIVRSLADPKSRIYLRNIARLGRGNINHKRWTTLMEITAQSLEGVRRQTLTDTR